MVRFDGYIDGCLPIFRKTIQAEANNPLWTKAIDVIYPKAREMMAKPRYWSVAFPLVITSLCVAPDVLFKKHWQSTFEASLPKLKASDGDGLDKCF